MSIRDERKQQNRQAIIDAALSLSTSQRSFTNISLREITRTVGLVPTAFYRHFENMDVLAVEIVDQTSLYLQNLIHQLGHTYLNSPQIKIEDVLELFLNAVDQNTQPWIFFMTEQWGGSHTLREAIARELNFLIENLSLDLKKIKDIQHNPFYKDLNSLAQILVNLVFHWAMTWINDQHQFSGDALKQQQLIFKQQTIIQIQLLFHGITDANTKKIG